jgi:hypothetical protein
MYSFVGDIFYPGGEFLIPKESKLKGEERKRRKRRRKGSFTIHLYSLFFEQFVVHNLNNLIMALKMRHTLFAYSLHICELLKMLCKQFEIQNLKYLGSGMGLKKNT